MAESSTPSGAEQYRIVKELMDAQSYTKFYKVSTSWIFMWEHHMANYDQLLYNPGKLRTTGDLTSSSTIDEFCNLGDNCSTTDEFCDLGLRNYTTWFGNMWVREPIWCKWVQWYGVDDGHVLDRRTRSTTNVRYWPNIPIRFSLKGDMGARVGYTSKVFNVSEKCGYIELQLRRIFGVTHDTETQLWVLYGNTANPLVLDRGKALMDYIVPEVRYDTGFLSLSLYRN